jgi:hypothetical protein
MTPADTSRLHMKQIYILPPEGREASAELLKCTQFLKSKHQIQCYASQGELGYGSFWVEDHYAQSALNLSREAGFSVVST